MADTSIRWSRSWAALLIVAAAACAGGSDAQTSGASAGGGQQADGEYRLTMPVLKKLLSVRTGDVSNELPVDKARFMNVNELEAEFERIPAIRTALASAGLSAAEAAPAWKAMQEAMEYLLSEEMAKA